MNDIPPRGGSVLEGWPITFGDLRRIRWLQDARGFSYPLALSYARAESVAAAAAESILLFFRMLDIMAQGLPMPIGGYEALVDAAAADLESEMEREATRYARAAAGSGIPLEPGTEPEPVHGLKVSR